MELHASFQVVVRNGEVQYTSPIKECQTQLEIIVGGGGEKTKQTKKHSQQQCYTTSEHRSYLGPIKQVWFE